MKQSIQYFYGTQRCKMDSQYRVYIPPPWRPNPGEWLYILPAMAHGMATLKVLREAAYREEIEQIENSDATLAEMVELRRRQAANSRQAKLNVQGELKIPQDLCDHVGIVADSEINLVGRRRHFEIWNTVNYEIMHDIEKRLVSDDPFGIL